MLLSPSIPEDTPHLTALTAATGKFKPMEIDALREVLDDYHAVEQGNDHFVVTGLLDDRIVGFTYHAPAPMTEGSWYLYWIAVDQSIQGKGIGGTLLLNVESHIRSLGGRALFIETSSLPMYELTRRFYLKHEYELTGIIKEFYAEGDDMVVFRKKL